MQVKILPQPKKTNIAPWKRITGDILISTGADMTLTKSTHQTPSDPTKDIRHEWHQLSNPCQLIYQISF